MRRWWKIGIVIAACALVGVGVGLPTFFSRLDDTPAMPKHKAQKDLEAFAGLIERLHAHNHRYPRDDEGLNAVLRFGDGMEQAPERHPLDPWRRPYVYRARTDGPPQVYSLGPNGIDEHGKGDDISASVQFLQRQPGTAIRSATGLKHFGQPRPSACAGYSSWWRGQGIELLPILAQIGSWGVRYLPVSHELGVRAQLLTDGGPPDVGGGP
jgi:hypothetical protein